jgi:hypothetical protein
LPSFENYPPPFTNETHYVTWSMMLARDVHGSWLAKAFIVMTTNQACTHCQYDPLRLLRACLVSSLCEFMGWVARGLEIAMAWESKDC